MAIQQFFKKIEDSDRKEVAILVRLSKNDANTIRESANIRKLSTADFIRRAALGRKADTRYEGMIVLQLSEVIKNFKELHAVITQTGVSPPEEDFLRLYRKIEDAMELMTDK